MTGQPMRIPTVENLRGLASLAVAWFHMTNGFNGSWVAWLGSGGWLGLGLKFGVGVSKADARLSH